MVVQFKKLAALKAARVYFKPGDEFERAYHLAIKWTRYCSAKNVERVALKAAEHIAIRAIRSCSASMDIGTRYCDGGYDVDHGLSVGSPPCSCGFGRHHVGSNGGIQL